MTDPEWDRVRRQLRALPARPRKVTGSENWVNGIQLLLDYLATVPPSMQRLTAPLRKFPSGFRKVQFAARDGVRLAAWMGIAQENGTPARRDGILLIPGLYTSKDNPRIRARCLRMLQEWGFHVLALDLRGVGESERVFTTPGWKEAEDIIDALRFFRENAPIERLHLYTESLAATASLVAAGMEGAAGRQLLNGRVVAMSPYADARRIVELYGTPEPAKTELGRDFVLVQRFFNGLLRLQGYKGGRFDSYVRDVAAHYGVAEDELMDRSSPSRWIRHANVPILVVHSEDDGLVPVSQARALADAADGNGNVDVWILPWGYHCLYEMADPTWYWSSLAAAFGATPRPGYPLVGSRSMRERAATQ